MLILDLNIKKFNSSNSIKVKFVCNNYHTTSCKKTVNWYLDGGQLNPLLEPLVTSGQYLLHGKMLAALSAEDRKLKTLVQRNDAEETDYLAQQVNDLFNAGSASSVGTTDKPWTNWLLVNPPLPSSLGTQPVISYGSLEAAKSKLILLAEGLDSSILFTELYPILSSTGYGPYYGSVLAWKMIKILPMVAAFGPHITNSELFQFLSVSSQFGCCLHKYLSEVPKINCKINPEVVDYLEQQTQIMRNISFTFFTCENFEDWG